jgi:hypothetical protein
LSAKLTKLTKLTNPHHQNPGFVGFVGFADIVYSGEYTNRALLAPISSTDRIAPRAPRPARDPPRPTPCLRGLKVGRWTLFPYHRSYV